MEKFILDEEQSYLSWTGANEKMTNHGQVKLAGGQFFVEKEKILKGVVTVDMTSLRVDDDTGLEDEDQWKLIKHLKSEEFFNVENYPEVEYQIHRVFPEEGEMMCEGKIVLKGEVINLNFPVEVEISDEKLHAHSKFDLPAASAAAQYALIKDYEGDPIKTELAFSIVAYPA